LKKDLKLYDEFGFNCERLTPEEIVSNIKYVAGVDISGSKIDDSKASVAITIYDFNTKKIVYDIIKIVDVLQPYIPGFLAFREVEHLISILKDLIKEMPIFIPDVIIVDGNGIYHSEGFGLACHLGVLCNIPTIGCGKTNFFVDGLTSDKVDKIAADNLFYKKEFCFLTGDSGKIHGAVMRCSETNNNNLIISQGHKISLETCCLIVKDLLIYKVVEPVRIADQLSREQIRKYDEKLKKK
jgi:deoxyinosine 3'endonuclease (endonuclease V)